MCCRAGLKRNCFIPVARQMGNVYFDKNAKFGFLIKFTQNRPNMCIFAKIIWIFALYKSCCEKYRKIAVFAKNFRKNNYIFAKQVILQIFSRIWKFSRKSEKIHALRICSQDRQVCFHIGANFCILNEYLKEKSIYAYRISQDCSTICLLFSNIFAGEFITYLTH